VSQWAMEAPGLPFLLDSKDHTGQRQARQTLTMEAMKCPKRRSRDLFLW